VRILIVYNPSAAHGRAGSSLGQVRGLLAVRGVDAEIRLTERPGHAVEIVRDADLGEFECVVAGGGDGTLFEVVNGYFLNPIESRPPLGVLPVGTGNSFARDIGLRTGALEQAIDLVCGGHHRAVDVGRFTTGGETYHYLNILGLGFVCDATQLVPDDNRD